MNQDPIKDLSIQVSLSGLSFCILNRASNTVEVLKDGPFQKKVNPNEALEHLKSTLSRNSEFNQAFSSVLLIHQNELSNLVPKDLFDEAQAADYLKFNSKILKSDVVVYDEIATNRSVNVYVPYMNINNFVLDTFGPFEYKHASTILIERLLKNQLADEAATVYLNVSYQHFEMVAIKDQKLLLYNSFEFTTKEDVIYYLLFTMEQLQLNPETVKLELMGRIEKDDALYSTIYTYVRFVEIYAPDYNFQVSTAIAPEKKHVHPILLNSF